MARARILAVASGKGGVGKTLTSVNLALTSARNGMRTALVDADPLSNAMSLLDNPNPDRPLPNVLKDPASQAFIAAPRMEVVFPQPKEGPELAGRLVKSLVTDHREWLDDRYSLVIIDMPAGTGLEGDFSYLDDADALLLVVNPEPTSHVAAGSLLRQINASSRQLPIYLWHNKYEARPEDAFDPDDVLGNYNRNVPKEEQIDDPGLQPIAYMPPDPALDLTKSDPPITVNLHRALVEGLEALADASLPPLPVSEKEGSRSAPLIAYFLRKAPLDEGPEAILGGLESFLDLQTGSDESKLPKKMEDELKRWIEAARMSPLRRQILKAREVASLRLEEMESQGGLFSTPGIKISSKALDREIIPLLKTLSCLPSGSPQARMAGLLLFRYSLIKLFANETAVKLILAFLPRRMEGGESIRDRSKQIARLVGKDSSYQEHYLALVKKLYPVVSRQMDHMVTTFGLHGLLFRGGDGVVAKNAYVKLFSATLYEIVNSGLGIVAGFRFRPSSRAFMEGYESLHGKLVGTKDSPTK